MINRVKCFGVDASSGNEALVIQNMDLLTNPEDRLQFAYQQNKPVTVFMKEAANNQLQLDFYYPHKRSPLCLHGTLAAGHIYFAMNHEARVVNIVTVVNNQQLSMEKTNTGICLQLHKQSIRHIDIDFYLIQELLNITNVLDVVDSYIASCGSPKLFVEISSLKNLYELVPNLELINIWSQKNSLTGVYVYCYLDDTSVSGCNFNHLDPALEDAATGVAAAAITSHITKDLYVYQGAAMNNSCVIQTKFLDQHTVQISGRTCLI